MVKEKTKRIAAVTAAVAVVLAGAVIGLWSHFRNQGPQAPSLRCVDGLTVEYNETVSVYDLIESVEGEGKLTLTLSGDGVAADGKSISFVQVGSYPLTVTATDENGLSAQEQVTVRVEDTTAPVLRAEDFSARLGEEVDYLAAVTAADGLDGDLLERVNVNADAVNLEEMGTYLVRYAVTDSAGNSAEASAQLTILPPAASEVTLSETECKLAGNGHIQLTATVEPENWEGKVTWESSNEAVAIVHSGLVSWTGEGEAVITAKAGDVSAECRVTCGSLKATSVWLNYHKATLEAYTEVTLTAQVLPSNYEGGVTWESSDTTVATVEDGVVTWVGQGTCTIRAVAGDVVDTCTVVCKAAPGQDPLTSFINSILGR